MGAQKRSDDTALEAQANSCESEDGAHAVGKARGKNRLVAADALVDTPGVASDKPAGEAVGNASSRVFDEGTIGLGIDIVEIKRMERILARTPSFASKVFSQAEQDYCDKAANPATHYALRFAAKEAVVKALGTGFSQGVWVNDIEVQRASNGRPSIRLSGRALEIAREQGVCEVSVSLSYTHTDAVACVLMVTEQALRASEERKDPMQELARQFKETRGILDEL